MIGTTLDRYQIESKLGEGGMGVVYKARDGHLDRLVAIKVLPHDKVADAARKQRFVQEAKAASALNHPGIVTVHDIRSDAGIDFIVMEYVEGQTLDEAIPAKGMRAAKALRYGVEIADAVAKAHEAGIIHRDLKPSNIMVTREGRIKILDFGLAKLLDPADALADVRTQTSPLTDEHHVVGTAAYMSPEQAEGRTLDARSDIFSFGSVLYEMITGRRPFAGDSQLAILSKILNEQPPAPSQLATVSMDVERTILRCLRKDPTRRFQTMADLKVALEDLAADSDSASATQTAAPAVRTARAWTKWAWVAVIPLAAIVSYFAWRAQQAPGNGGPLRAVPLLSLPGVTRSPTFSPDGNQIAFGWTGPDGNNPDIYVQQIGAGAPLRLTTDPSGDYSPEWSPDGRWIAFLRGQGEGTPQEVKLVPPLGGSERTLTKVRPRGFLRAPTLTWCPDTSCLVVTDSSGENNPDALYVVSLDSGEKRRLTSPENPVYADSDPAISPDGRWLVFRREVAPFTGELMLVPLGSGPAVTGEPRSLTPFSLAAYGPSWTSDSEEILFSAKEGLWRLRISGDGPPERMPFVGEDGLSPVVSRAQADRPARLVYVRAYADVNIWRVTTAGPGAPASSPPAVAIASNRRDAIPDISLDGRRVTFTSTRSGEHEVWAADITGANAIQLTSMAANPGWPRWSPDGRQIAFHSNPEGNGEVFVVPSEGGKYRNLSVHQTTDTFASFSRDGQWVYFTSDRVGQRVTIWKVPAGGGTPLQVSPALGMMSIESPDGTFVYYTETTNTNSPGPLWRVPVAGGPPEKIVDRVFASLFDVLDGGIYHIEPRAEGNRLQYFDLATRTSTTVADNLGPVDFGLTASPDGRTILYARVDSSLNDVILVESFR